MSRHPIEPFDQPDALTICIDLKDPYCHLALPATLDLLARCNAQLQSRWLPFDRHAMHAPAVAQAKEDRGTSHRRTRDTYRERELRHYADAAQLPLARLYENPDTTVFASALLWLQTQPPAIRQAAEHTFLRACFLDYWSGAFAAEDRNGFAQRLDDCGAQGTAWLADGMGQTLVDQQRQALRDAGLFNSPAYLYQGEVYYGRAHLPLLEALTQSAASP